MAGVLRTADTARNLADVRPLSEIVEACRAAFGSDLVAYLAGAGADRPLAEWRLTDALKQPLVRLRLTAALDLLRLFKEPQRAREWLRDVNLDLGRRSPAEAIRAARSRRDLARVRSAAEAAPQD